MNLILTKKEIKAFRKFVKELPEGILDTEEIMDLLKRAKEAAKEGGECVIEFDDNAFLELVKKLDELDDDIEQIITDAAEATTETVEAAMSGEGEKEPEKVLTAEEIEKLPAKDRWAIPIRSKKEQEEANAMGPFEVNFRPHEIDSYAEVDIILYHFRGYAAAKVDKDGKILKFYAVRFPGRPSISLGDLAEDEIEALKRPTGSVVERNVWRKVSLKEAVSSMEMDFEDDSKFYREKYGPDYEAILPKHRIAGDSWRKCPAASY